ncbi:MAG: radical SAM protein [Mangrovibacterium sp.]
MEFKASKFNLLINYSLSDYLVFNTFTSSLIKIDKLFYQEIINSLSKKEFISEHIDALEALIKLGVLTDSSFSEKTEIRRRNIQWRHDSKMYSIAIIPNIDCNFRCKYCFEDIQPRYMSEQVQENIEHYLNKRIENNNIDSLGISWYGGEPLLSKDIILRLSRTFKKISKYRAFLYTNGFDFDDEFIYQLSPIGITLVHITIDGTKGVHDSYRIHQDGINTFDRIAENIQKIIDYNNDRISINIRSNLDNQNKANYPDLIQFFSEKIHSNKISFQVHRIQNVTTGIGINYCDEMREDDFNNFYEVVMKGLISNNYRKPQDFLPRRLDCHHCYVGMDNGFAINYDGIVYKCFADVNPSNNPIGVLNDHGEIDFNSIEDLRWKDYDCLKNENCSKCILLPVCMGGCTRQRLGLADNLPMKCDQKKAISSVKRVIKSVYELSRENQ